MTHVAIAVLIPVGVGGSPSGVMDSFKRQAPTPDGTLWAGEIFEGAGADGVEAVFNRLAIYQARAIREREEALKGSAEVAAEPVGEPVHVEAEDPQV